MNTILITGDRGYIGSVLVPLILRKKYKVIGLDASYFGNHIRKTYSNYISVIKDIREIKKNDLKGINAVIHLCALSNDPMGELDKKLTEDINLVSTLKLARLCKEEGIERFIFSSSCSVYGIAKSEVVNEESEVNPLTTYGKSKYLVEEGLKKIADKDFCACIMRNATVYGYSPKFRDDLVVNNLVAGAIALGKIRVLSDGTPWRPLIDVRDLSRAFIEFLEAPKEKISGIVINVGFTNSNFRVKDIVSLIKKELLHCKVVFTNDHGSDSRSYRVNFDKFHKLFPEFRQEWPMGRSIHDLVLRLKKIKYNKRDFISKKYTRLTVLKNLIDSGILDKKLFYRK